MRVALLAPSPIPFKVPLYRRIAAAEGIDLTVMYACSMGVRPATAGYSENIVWDTALLDGYRARFLSAADRTAPVAVSITELVNPDVIPWLVRERFDVLWSDGYSWITNQMAILTQRARRMGVVMRDEQTLLHPRGLVKTVVKEIALRSLFSALDAAVYMAPRTGVGSSTMASAPNSSSTARTGRTPSISSRKQSGCATSVNRCARILASARTTVRSSSAYLGWRSPSSQPC